MIAATTMRTLSQPLEAVPRFWVWTVIGSFVLLFVMSLLYDSPFYYQIGSAVFAIASIVVGPRVQSDNWFIP